MIAFLIHEKAPFSHINVYNSFVSCFDNAVIETIENFLKNNQSTFDWIFVFDHYKVRSQYDLLKKYGKLAIWILEDTYEIDATLNLNVDVVFTNDEGAISVRQKHNQNVFLLPLAYNASIFYPDENIEKVRDIAVIGNAFLNRRLVVYFLKDFIIENKLKVDLFGINWDKTEYKTEHINVFNGLISEKQLADIYRSSKIALEINRDFHNQNVNGVIPLTPGRGFSSLGCECFTITDKRKTSEKYFPSDCIGYYNTIDELQQMLMLSENEKKQIAKKGCFHVQKEHIWKQRAIQMLQILK